MPTLDEHYEAYKTDGFTIFEKVFDESQMQSWRDKHQELSTANDGQMWFGNTLELVPELMWPTVSHPTILEFLEKVMGPFVQLDNLTLAAFASIENRKRQKARSLAGTVTAGRMSPTPMPITAQTPSTLYLICRT